MKVRLPNNNGGGNMNQMLAKAQKMQADMQNLQADLEQREYTATAGGLVEITVDGKHFVKSVKINPEAVDTDDIEMLEDFITLAFNEALNKAVSESETEMGAITSGLNLPGMF